MSLKPKIYKAFSLILIVIFSVFSITAIIYGLKLNFADNSDRKIDFEETGSFLIFIGGNVENEGFYEIRYSTTYLELFKEAGVLDYNGLSSFEYSEAVKPYEGYIICDCIVDGENFETQNINYAEIKNLVKCGIPNDKVDAVKKFVTERNGISDKNLLVKEGLLTQEEFDDVKYKIYAYII